VTSTQARKIHSEIIHIELYMEIKNRFKCKIEICKAEVKNEVLNRVVTSKNDKVMHLFKVNF